MMFKFRQALSLLPALLLAGTGNAAAANSEQQLLDAALKKQSAEAWFRYLSECQRCSSRAEALMNMQELQYQYGGKALHLGSKAILTKAAQPLLALTAQKAAMQPTFIANAAVQPKRARTNDATKKIQSTAATKSTKGALKNALVADALSEARPEETKALLAQPTFTNRATTKQATRSKNTLKAASVSAKAPRAVKKPAQKRAGTQWKTIAGVGQVAYATSGKQLAGATNKSHIQLWSASGEKSGQLSGYQGNIRTIEFSADNRWLAAAGTDNKIHIWDIQKSSKHQVFIGHSAAINAISFSPLGKNLLSVSANGEAFIWQMGLSKPVSKLNTYGKKTSASAFSTDGQQVALGTEDGYVHLYKANDGAITKRLWSQSGAVNAISFSPSGKTLASAGDSAVVQLWDLDSYSMTSLVGHRKGINDLHYLTNGKKLISASNDGTAKVWNVDRAKLIRSFNANKAILSVSASQNGKFIAAATGENAIKHWRY